MKKIDYVPPMHFYMYPAPGPMAKLPEANGALAVTTFEEHPPFTSNPRAASSSRRSTSARRRRACPTPPSTRRPRIVLDLAGARGRGHGDEEPGRQGARQWLKKNQVDTIQGRLRFDGPNNYGDDLMRVKQVQNGQWVVVWPKEFAAPGAKLLVP